VQSPARCRGQDPDGRGSCGGGSRRAPAAAAAPALRCLSAPAGEVGTAHLTDVRVVPAVRALRQLLKYVRHASVRAEAVDQSLAPVLALPTALVAHKADHRKRVGAGGQGISAHDGISDPI
jgi:hypothetical protein